MLWNIFVYRVCTDKQENIYTYYIILYYITYIEGRKCQLGYTKTSQTYGNIAEWIAFVCLISGVLVLSLSFHHDPSDDEISQFRQNCSTYIKEK